MASMTDHNSDPGWGSPGLITVDVGGTLGDPTAPGLGQTLVALSGRPKEVAGIMAGLLVTAQWDESRIPSWCEYLGIEVAQFPRQCVTAGLTLYPSSVPAVRRLANLAPTVTLSNTLACHVHHHTAVREACPELLDCYRSCQLGVAKPDRRVFETVAGFHHVDPTAVIHVGDSWEADIVGALGGGGRAVWISHSRRVPDPELLTTGRVLVAKSIAEAAAMLAGAQRAGSK